MSIYYNRYNYIIKMTSHYTDLNDFLIKHKADETGPDGKKIATHTRIPGKVGDTPIYGGSYNIPKEELEAFYNIYYDHVFVKGRKEYLTEKQIENGPLLIDFDFKYDFDIRERQHDKSHIQDIIYLYLEELKDFFIFKEDKPIEIFVLEKPNVNRVTDKQITKDGIHMIFGIQMNHILQMMLRDRVLEKIGQIIDLPLVNPESETMPLWETVIDKVISAGTTGWQLYGSQKPGHEAYKMTYHITATIDEGDNEFQFTNHKVSEFNFKKNFIQLSAQYTGNPIFELTQKAQVAYNQKLSESKPKTVKQHNNSNKSKTNFLLEEEDEVIDVTSIRNKDMLDRAIEAMFKDLRINEYYLKELHQYVMILPAKYYQPGSHYLNRLVAFALKHTDNRLFISWVALRAKASDFDYDTIPDLYNKWNKDFHHRPDGVTKKSILYWAKHDAFEEYEKIKRSTVKFFIEETLNTCTDYDFAMVLYELFKDKYVCSSITNKRWYVFKNHRWELDEGETLRLAISRDMFEEYQIIQNECMNELQQFESTDPSHENISRKIKSLAHASNDLKVTSKKNNIIREAMSIFYDQAFIKNMDANKYLMCFKNGVIDFKNKIFRPGYPQDYITKSTNIKYIPFDPESNRESAEQIMDFMEKLFPIPSLCKYMWDHLASCLIGAKKEQVFNIYCGSGSNGKSILTDLMTQTLGEYKGTVPITLVTEKRNNIGGTSPEVIQLKGIRYAVMQEPSKDAVINEGVMKELTGGDPIQARALYCDSEIFEPQFSLVVCTNSLFEIKSNDDGTWRRLKKVDFLAKFISEGETHTDDTKFVFPKDKSLKDKLPIWAPIFAAMLVKRAFETEGVVIDCPEVLEASNKYRQGQDVISGFITEKVKKVIDGKGIKKRELSETFKEWFQECYGGRKPPKLGDVEEIMNKKFGNRKADKWLNCEIIYDNKDTLEELEEV
jgi:P4 family phage/plasmid primase-like protien